MSKAYQRTLTYAQAIKEAIAQSMARNAQVFVIGEGVPDPKGIFGTTLNLQKQFGKKRVFDMPVSENGMTGICLGTALYGMRPIMVHQRVDFALLACDQIINNVAKWHYMFGGKQSVPMVIRMIIGRGWGQGSQHSQSLQALYAHIPGLKVVMPATAFDAKGMLIAAVEDDNPVIFIEHRWLHGMSDYVPKRYYKEPLNKAKIRTKGSDVTIVATSYMTIEALRAVNILSKEGISIEVIDARCLKPLDISTIIQSVKKTSHLLVLDTGYNSFGFASEVIAKVCQYSVSLLKSSPQTLTLPNTPTPTSWKAAEFYYPTHVDIMNSIMMMMDFPKNKIQSIVKKNSALQSLRSDVPDLSFSGPF